MLPYSLILQATAFESHIRAPYLNRIVHSPKTIAKGISHTKLIFTDPKNEEALESMSRTTGKQQPGVNIAQPPVVPNLQRMSQAFEDQLSTKEAVLGGQNILCFRYDTAIEELRWRKVIASNVELKKSTKT